MRQVVIRTDPELKAQAEEILSQLGMTMNGTTDPLPGGFPGVGGHAEEGHNVGGAVEIGMTMNGTINMFLHQIVRDRAVPLSLALPRFLSTEETLQISRFFNAARRQKARPDGRLRL